MQINIQDKELMLCKKGIKEKISTWVEQDILVPDTKPDVMQIISVNVVPYVSNVDVFDEKLNVSGNLNYFIIYKVSDGNYGVRGVFVSYPFSENLNVKGLKKGMNVIVKPRAKNVISSLPNERKILVKTELEFDICVKDYDNVRLVTDFEYDKDLEKKLVTDTFSNIKVNKRSIIASKDDVLLPKEASDLFEILRVDSKIKNTEIKESFNKIMLKGDILMNIIYLAENKEDGVRSTEIVVPFTGMVEIENINDKSKFDIEYLVQDLNISLNRDITTTKALNIDYKIEADVTMYEREEIAYIEDFYSQYENLEYNERNVDIIKDFSKTECLIDVKESVSGIFNNQKLIDCSCDLNSLNYSINSNIIKVNGNVKASILLQNIETGEIESKSLDILIDKEARDDNINLSMKNDIKISLKDCKMVQNEENLEIMLTIKLEVCSSLEGSVKIVENLSTKKIDTTDLDSMNIYIVKENDNLWNIAKKYKTSVENIARINEELRDADVSVGQKILIIR